ncbi:MAG TPA: MarR family transcriptional regulator [Candidatus Acidoferrum sp.]|nr:MarR family transcriptional regulator [Candidatus Acidoferrum sp.]
MNRRLRVLSDSKTKREIGLPADDDLSIDVYDQPGHLIRRAHQISVSMFYATIGYDVTPIQYAVLRILQDHPGIDQVTLARYCALDTSTAADLAVRLEERGLVKRMMPMKSKRFRLLHLTSEGALLLKKLVPSVYMMNRRLVQPLTKEEQKIFLRLLRKFVHLNNAKSRAPLDRAGAGGAAGPAIATESRRSRQRKQA